MTEHSNPATRIFSLVNQVLTFHNQSVSTPKGWAEIFRIEQPVEALLAFDVAKRLTEVVDEVLLLRRALGETTRIRPQVYQHAVSQLIQMFSPVHLSGHWSSVRNNFSPESLRLLETFQATLPQSYEEQEISLIELSAIREIAENLVVSSESPDLSKPVKQFIQRQANIIRRALELYPIQGARALREAHRFALVDIIDNREMVRENAEQPQMQEVASVWKRIGTACNVARGVDAALRIGEQVWEMISSGPSA